MVPIVYLLCLGFLAHLSQGFTLFTHNKLNFGVQFRSRPIFVTGSEASNPVPRESVGDSENKQVDKGLTHIKYNKYAPSAEEAASMTDEQFRGVIYKRMREAEKERRKSGLVGSAVSDDYINSLGKKPEPSAE